MPTFVKVSYKGQYFFILHNPAVAILIASQYWMSRKSLRCLLMILDLMIRG